MSNRTSSAYPLSDLLAKLPTLTVNTSQAIDYPACDARQLASIQAEAEATIQIIHLGICGVSELMSASAVPREGKAISSDSIASIGRLLSCLGSVAAALMTLSKDCHHEISDWVGPKNNGENK